MNYSNIIKELDQATSFDLFRLSSAIDKMLEDPKRIANIKQSLRIGQEVEYFDGNDNRVVNGTVVKFLPTKVVVENRDDGKRWRLPFYMINIHKVDTQITDGAKQGLGRNEVGVGDFVGFLDRDNHERYGTVVRLNPKTVTLDSDHGQWRVSYGLLFKVLNPEAEQLVAQQNPQEEQAINAIGGAVLPNDTSLPPPPASSEMQQGKVGRNNPCPCGSGKKHKKCCLA